jgi:hypothetical protein
MSTEVHGITIIKMGVILDLSFCNAVYFSSKFKIETTFSPKCRRTYTELHIVTTQLSVNFSDFLVLKVKSKAIPVTGCGGL